MTERHHAARYDGVLGPKDFPSREDNKIPRGHLITHNLDCKTYFVSVYDDAELKTSFMVRHLSTKELVIFPGRVDQEVTFAGMRVIVLGYN